MLPRWISWLFLLFLAYLIYTGTNSNHVNSPSDVKPVNPRELPSSSLSEYPQLQKLTNGNRWKRALNPNYIGDVKITDTTQGKGEPAHCGDRITIHLRGTLPDGANFDPHHDESKPLTFTLGDAPYPVLNTALLGMREGGVRQISAPPQLVLKKNTPKTLEDILLRVEMNKRSGETLTASNTFGTRIYQEVEGNGKQQAACGNTVKLTMQLWNTAGNIAYQTPEPITLTLGKDTLPTSLTEALDGITMGEQRTVILPPEATKAAILPEEIRSALAGKQMVMMSVERKD